MLTLDHIPFHGSLTRLRSAFTKLGFQISPAGHYLSAERPEKRWPNHCVFLRSNWFDLIGATPHQPGAHSPSACLLRTRNLSESIADLGDLVAGRRYKLARHWDEDLSLPEEAFELVGLSWKAGLLPVSIIQHAYPCGDTKSEWFAHPNTAISIAGLTLVHPSAQQVPEILCTSADLSWLSFAQKATSNESTITIRVSSLTAVAATLAGNGVPFDVLSDSILVTSAPDLHCAWEFSE